MLKETNPQENTVRHKLPSLGLMGIRWERRDGWLSVVATITESDTCIKSPTKGRVRDMPTTRLT